jgi:cobalt-zinc-cadmium efflux system membrane fusion protein
MNRSFRFAWFALLVPLSAVALAACMPEPQSTAAEAGEPGAAAADFERGPHNGRLLRDGNFSLEVTVFETGVPPELHVYPYMDGKAVDPSQVQLAMAVSRLGGEVNRFNFQPREDYLRADAVLHEPHSFDVTATAAYGGAAHNWSYESYEGRTTIAQAAADAAGVKTENAGKAVLEDSITIAGRIELQPQGKSEVRAWYPGRILEMNKIIGDRVQKGEIVARVESSSSLQTYPIPAPMSGVVTERRANVGDIAAEQALYVLSDTTKVHAELFMFPGDAERVRVGQPVEIRSVSGGLVTRSEVEVLLPTADLNTQALLAHVELPNANAQWRPGMGVEGSVVVSRATVPLAVRTRALQRFRDFTVVYMRVGETYEVRMLQLGRQTAEWTEVLGGLEPGTEYVTDNAFLIRADVEKSGATHDH